MPLLRFACCAPFAFASLAQSPALTIYNQNFAVVRDRVTLELKEGVNDVQFAGVTALLEPDSVVLRDPSDKVRLTVVEQCYRADTISPGLLLAQFEGKELDFLVGSPNAERVVRGKVIRSGYTPTTPAMRRQGVGPSYHHPSSAIVEVDGQLHFQLPGQPLFPALTDDAILTPRLSWRLFAEEAVKVDAEVSYVTAGLSWEATWNFVAPETGDTMDVVGWITIDNESGKEFVEASVKLMAGDVNKVDPTSLRNGGPLGPSTACASVPALPAITEKAFDEFHLYALPLALTMRHREQKQVEFLRATGVETKTLYVFNGAAFGHRGRWHSQPDYGSMSNAKVFVMREFANTKANGLGVALPKGRTRFYRRDDADGRLEFVGENLLDHTPKDETVRVYTGDAFDIVGGRKRMNEKTDGGTVEETIEIRVRNHKDKAVDVRVFERLWLRPNWEIVEKSHDFVKKDVQSVEFPITVPTNGETVVTYRVRYSG